jgi:hypothetical protein
VQDPGPIDITAALSPNGFQTGNGAVPPILALTTTQRPQPGTTIVFETTNITSPVSPTLFSFFAIGFSGIPAPGTSLAFIDMPGCYQLVGLPVTATLTSVVNGVSSSPLPIPGGATYLGQVLYAQSAPITQGYNLAGLVTSNGLCVRVGQ